MTDKLPVLPLSDEKLIRYYRMGYRSRQASIIGRREVLTGKAKFGIFGDGKELIQLAIAEHFRPGDWRSGYYRDQTWMLALNLLTLEQFFAQLYAHADPDFDPHSGGRNMNSHFASPLIDKNEDWISQSNRYNTSADAAPTASQMPRSVGLAYASVLYRELEELKQFKQFSNNGNEIAWVSIGNASTAEGPFWEAVNAIGVLKAPAIISIYDDGYGISVPNEFQMVKENISAILEGFRRIQCPAEQCNSGYDIYHVRAWDFPALWQAYSLAEKNAREHHIPALYMLPMSPSHSDTQPPVHMNATRVKNAWIGKSNMTVCAVSACILSNMAWRQRNSSTNGKLKINKPSKQPAGTPGKPSKIRSKQPESKQQPCSSTSPALNPKNRRN